MKRRCFMGGAIVGVGLGTLGIANAIGPKPSVEYADRIHDERATVEWSTETTASLLGRTTTGKVTLTRAVSELETVAVRFIDGGGMNAAVWMLPGEHGESRTFTITDPATYTVELVTAGGDETNSTTKQIQLVPEEDKE